MSRISVIIPNYNRESLLGQTITNLLKQSLPPAEIIVVDDGSTDGSIDVIRSFGTSVKLLQQSNQGPGRAQRRVGDCDGRLHPVSRQRRFALAQQIAGPGRVAGNDWHGHRVWALGSCFSPRPAIDISNVRSTAIRARRRMLA